MKTIKEIKKTAFAFKSRWRCLAREVPSLDFSPSALARFLRTLVLFAVALVVAGSDISYGRDLVDAAQSAQTMFNRIGVAAISIGITLGGILFALGMAQVGRMLLISGAIGAVAILGAPALIQILGRIFGASL